MAMPQTPPAPPPAPVPPSPPEFDVTPDAELEDLLMRFEIAKTALADAEQQKNALDAAIKTRLTALAPPGTKVINVPPGRYRPAMRLGWNTPRKFDRQAFDRAYPHVYDRFLTWAAPGWGWRKAAG
jgi:hypothetical protein